MNTTDTTNINHRYIDDIILCEELSFGEYGDPLILFCNCEGKSETIDPTQGNFSASDMVDTYRRLIPEDYYEDQEGETQKHLEAFKAHLLETGATIEELGEE